MLGAQKCKTVAWSAAEFSFRQAFRRQLAHLIKGTCEKMVLCSLPAHYSACRARAQRPPSSRRSSTRERVSTEGRQQLQLCQ